MLKKQIINLSICLQWRDLFLRLLQYPYPNGNIPDDITIITYIIIWVPMFIDKHTRNNRVNQKTNEEMQTIYLKIARSTDPDPVNCYYLISILSCVLWSHASVVVKSFTLLYA